MNTGHVGQSRKRLRFHRLLALLGALLLALAVVSLPSPAAAHGVAMGPGSRTYLCYLDLLQNGSTQMPSNPACRAAVQQASTTPLYNWFAVLDSNAGGRSVGYVPDGKLCSAGDRSPYNFSPYNAARTDWPKTHLTSGSSIQINYSNWAHHPGRFEVYITNNGWSPTTPLAWGDLTRRRPSPTRRRRVARVTWAATITGTCSCRRGPVRTCSSSSGSVRTAMRTSSPAPTSSSTAARVRSRVGAAARRRPTRSPRRRRTPTASRQRPLTPGTGRMPPQLRTRTR